MVTIGPLTHQLVYKLLKPRSFGCVRLLIRQVDNMHIGSSHSLNHTGCLSLYLRSYSSSSFSNRIRKILKPLQLDKFRTKSSAAQCEKPEEKGSSKPTASSKELFGEAANKGLIDKFKHMYKQYWYVLIPIHVVTSIGWFGGFYYLSKIGVDVPALLQYIPLSETTIESLASSDAGHYAFSYLCYNTATPVRYALTLGCTTISIKYLSYL